MIWELQKFEMAVWELQKFLLAPVKFVSLFLHIKVGKPYSNAAMNESVV